MDVSSQPDKARKMIARLNVERWRVIQLKKLKKNGIVGRW